MWQRTRAVQPQLSFRKFSTTLASSRMSRSAAHLGLGSAYALSGDTTKAQAAYQDFLTLWKDADPDIPILQEAKAEYATVR